MRSLSFTFLFILSLNSLFAQDILLNWAAGFGNYSPDVISAVASDDSGYVYAVGDFEQTIDFDPDTSVFNLTSAGISDIFILKLDAQGKLVWAHQVGGPFAAICGDMTIDQNGNVYVTGWFQFTMDFDPDTASTYNLTSAGANDAFVFKLDNNGIFQWARHFGSSTSEGGDAICLDPSGNVIVAGHQAGTSDLDPGIGVHNVVSKGGDDVFIVKLNSSGNFIWGKNIGGTGTDEVNDINSDASGNLYLTGSFTGSSDLDPHPTATDYRLSNGVFDYYVEKMSGSGNLIWAHTFGKFGSDEALSVVTNLGEVYVAGYFRGTVDFDPDTATVNVSSASGSADPFVQKFDSSGDFKWVKVLAGSGNAGINAAQIGYSGNIYLTGSFFGTTDFDPDTATYYLSSTTGSATDVFVQNMDTAGNMIWTIAYGSTSYDHGTTITTNRFGNVITGGAFTYTVDFDPDTSTFSLTSNSFHTDAFIQSIKECLTEYTVDSVVSCKASYTWIDSNTYTASTDTPTVVLTNFKGCDSVVTLSLIIEPLNTIDSIVSCSAVTWIDSITYFESNDTAQHIYSTSTGCDSIITLNLTITANQVIDEVNVCEAFTWIDSITYTNSTDTPMVVFTNANSCDSIVKLDLTITRPDVNVSLNGNTLSSQATSSVFQWIDCKDNFSQIPGAIGSTFTAKENGSYAVIVTKKGCSDTSECVDITGLSIRNYGGFNSVNVYPNPNSGIFFVEFDNVLPATLNIYNTHGSLMYTTNIIEKKVAISEPLSKGIYFLEIVSESEIVRKKIVVEFSL